MHAWNCIKCKRTSSYSMLYTTSSILAVRAIYIIHMWKYSGTRAPRTRMQWIEGVPNTITKMNGWSGEVHMPPPPRLTCYVWRKEDRTSQITEKMGSINGTWQMARARIFHLSPYALDGIAAASSSARIHFDLNRSTISNSLSTDGLLRASNRYIDAYRLPGFFSLLPPFLSICLACALTSALAYFASHGCSIVCAVQCAIVHSPFNIAGAALFVMAVSCCCQCKCNRRTLSLLAIHSTTTQRTCVHVCQMPSSQPASLRHTAIPIDRWMNKIVFNHFPCAIHWNIVSDFSICSITILHPPWAPSFVVVFDSIRLHAFALWECIMQCLIFNRITCWMRTNIYAIKCKMWSRLFSENLLTVT